MPDFIVADLDTFLAISDTFEGWIACVAGALEWFAFVVLVDLTIAVAVDTIAKFEGGNDLTLAVSPDTSGITGLATFSTACACEGEGFFFAIVAFTTFTWAAFGTYTLGLIDFFVAVVVDFVVADLPDTWIDERIFVIAIDGSVETVLVCIISDLDALEEATDLSFFTLDGEATAGFAEFCGIAIEAQVAIFVVFTTSIQRTTTAKYQRADHQKSR